MQKKALINSIYVSLLESIIVTIFFVLSGYDDILKTLALVFISSLIVYIVCKRIQISDFSKSYIMLFFVVRFTLLLLMFQFGWKTTLEVGSSVAGYDPERYYYQAIELIDSNFVLRKGIINYAGIIYYYALLFKLFGINPIVPIIANCMTTEIVVILFAEMINRYFRSEYISKNLNKAVLLLTFIPELMWYDVLSSRESICMALVFIAIYNIMRITNDKFTAKRLIAVIVITIMVGLIRMSLVLPIIAVTIVCLILLSKKGIDSKKILFLVVVIGSIGVLPQIAGNIGSAKVSLSSLFDSLSSSAVLANEELNWSSNSIGKMLIADSPVKILILSPVRMAVYLITPLPSMQIDFAGIKKGIYTAWQGVYVLLSSIIYLTMVPKIIATFIALIKGKVDKVEKKQSFAIFLVLMFTIACGNQIIHDRYRIVAVPWIVLAYFIGKGTDKRTKKIGWIVFIPAVCAAILLYVVLKLR